MQLREDVVEMFLFHFLEEYSQRPVERAGDGTEGDRSELLSRCHGGMVPPDRAWPVSTVPGAWLSLAGTGLLGHMWPPPSGRAWSLDACKVSSSGLSDPGTLSDPGGSHGLMRPSSN